jgi:cytochrome b561
MMNPDPASLKATRLLIALHWITLALLVVLVLLMELRGIFPKGSVPREAMKAGHYLLGSTVLVLTLLRIAVRSRASLPPVVPPLPRWQHRLAGVVQWSLYALLMPLIGWSLLSAGEAAFPLTGWPVPAVPGVDRALEHTLEEFHETGANLVYILVGVHAAAALYHHYLVGDNTLRRMCASRTGKADACTTRIRATEDRRPLP